MAKARKFTALVLSAVMTAAMAAPAYAESSAPEPISSGVVCSMELASKTVEWNGKTALKKGNNYVVTKDVTVSKKITVPAGVTLTVKDGAKLWVSTKGSLYIKGAVVVGKNSTMAVSGTLHQYKGKKLTVTGTVKFGNKADITLDGKVVENSKGVISGNPKKLSVSESALLSLKGKNSCAKLTDAVYAIQLSDVIEGYINTVVENDLDFSPMVSEMFPKERLAEIEENIKTQTGMTMTQFSALMTSQIKAQMKEEGSDMTDIKSLDMSAVDIKAKDLKNCYDSLTDEEKETLKQYYGDTKTVYSFSVGIWSDGKEIESDEIKSQTARMALVDGKWYMF